MIHGIGTDIIRIERMKTAMERTPGFEEKVFAPSEIEYCRSKARPEQHFAARFAAKEAVMKALGTGWSGGVRFQDIVIVNDSLGRPAVEIHGPSEALINPHGKLKIWVSLSHDAGAAVAMVIIETLIDPPTDESRRSGG